MISFCFECDWKQDGRHWRNADRKTKILETHNREKILQLGKCTLVFGLGHGK